MNRYVMISLPIGDQASARVYEPLKCALKIARRHCPKCLSAFRVVAATTLYIAFMRLLAVVASPALRSDGAQEPRYAARQCRA